MMKIEAFRWWDHSDLCKKLQVTAILSLAAACSSAGVVVLYARDLDVCATRKTIPCNRYQISVAMAFVTWVLTAMSSHVMFWILASV